MVWYGRVLAVFRFKVLPDVELTRNPSDQIDPSDRVKVTCTVQDMYVNVLMIVVVLEKGVRACVAKTRTVIRIARPGCVLYCSAVHCTWRKVSRERSERQLVIHQRVRSGASRCSSSLP